MATKYKSRQEAEKAERKKLVRKNLNKIKKLMNKVETLFNELPNQVQNDMLEVHNPDYSLNHAVRWGVQASEELLDKKNFKTITENL
jgi:hypothetical protein